MNTSNDAVRAAMQTFGELLPGWSKGEVERESWAEEIVSLERYARDPKAEDHLPWTMRNPDLSPEQRREEFEQVKESRAKRLADLHEERRRHDELTKRLMEAEQVLFQFGDARAIDTDPLRRLLDGDMECADAVIPILRRLNAALDRESESGAGGKQPSPTKPDNKPASETADTPEDEGDERPAEPKANMTWQEAAERMKRLRDQGEPWTSQHKLSERFGCSSGTINKALRKTPELQRWATRQTVATPRAQSLNEVVTDHTAQNVELAPEDNAAIREFIEQADPETKAWFLSLKAEDQLAFLDDPDNHQQILGRKP